MQIVLDNQVKVCTPKIKIILMFQATSLISVQYLYWVSASLVSEIRRGVSILHPTQAELQNV